MKRVWIAVLFSLLCLPAFAGSKAVTYQEGKILTATKQASPVPSGGTDAHTAPSRDRYDITIQVGDTIYTCRYFTASDQDLTWIQGKTAPVRVKGKEIFVKRLNGSEAKGSILSSAPAPKGQ